LTCAVFLSPFNLFTLMPLYSMCSILFALLALSVCVRYFVRPFLLNTTIFVRPVGPFYFMYSFCRPFYLTHHIVRPVGPFCFMYSILFTLSTLHLFTLVLFCKRIQLYIRPSGLHMSTLFSGAAPVRSLARTATSIYHFLPVWNMPLDSTV